jgi:hypothetical protein
MNEETNRSQRRQQYKHKAKHTKPKSNTKSSNDEEEVREGFLPPPLMIICHTIIILKTNQGSIDQQVCIEVLSAVIR